MSKTSRTALQVYKRALRLFSGKTLPALRNRAKVSLRFSSLMAHQRSRDTQLAMKLFRKFFQRQLTTYPPADELFLFVHMPKTGGQSLKRFFKKHVAPQDFIHLVSSDNQNAHLGWQPAEFACQSPDVRMQARIILGHEVKRETHNLVPGKIPRHILFLREPAERLVSHYNFRMKLRRAKGKPLVSFEEWYDDSRKGNMMTNWLLSEYMMERRPRQISRKDWRRVQRTLRGFWFVGCTEFLDRDAPLLFQRIGVHGELEHANVAGVHHERTLVLDGPLRDQLRADNPFDVELYEYWKARLDKSRARILQELADANPQTAAF